MRFPLREGAEIRAVSTAKVVLKPGFFVDDSPRQGNTPAITGLEGLLLFAGESLKYRFCNDVVRDQRENRTI
jgi:hypothetical protein